CAILFALIAAVSAGGLAPSYINTGSSSQFRSQDNAGNYNFGYDEEHATGGSFRREKGDAHGNKVGSYGLRDIDGRLRVVNYVADHFGFRADIQTNEPGVEPKDPAATSINKAPAKILAAPALAAPIHAAPAFAEPIHAAPALAAPIHAAPALAAPIHAEPAYAAPVHAAPALAAPIHDEPIFAAPLKAAPIASTLISVPSSIATYAKTFSSPVSFAAGPPVLAKPGIAPAYGGYGGYGSDFEPVYAPHGYGYGPYIRK
ncbi:Cuticle protein 14-like isoform b, partial [Dinothrombium tinctorium]